MSILQNKKVLKTNTLICIILIIGFTLTAMFSYHANYQSSIDNIEEVSSLTTEGIYYQLTTLFTKPVNISLTMAHDSLLVEHLSNEQETSNLEAFIEITKNYLDIYKQKYHFDSVFLVSAKTNNYYNYNGYDRTLNKDDLENNWYYDLLQDNQEYTINVDNDEVNNANNDITVFVNCKIINQDNEILGIVGIGIRLAQLEDLLSIYEDKYGVSSYLVNSQGNIQISTSYNGFQTKDWFKLYNQEKIKKNILSWKSDNQNLELWSVDQNGNKNFIVTRFIPELSWHLIVEQNTGQLILTMKNQLYLSSIIIIAIIIIVLFIITSVIKKFNKQITILSEKNQAVFKEATEHLYDNIYELNISKNCLVGIRTEQYFESLGAKGLPYNDALEIIAKKQIKKEFREDYIKTFNTENVTKVFENGNNHLRYDFMISEDGTNYFWMRIDAYIFISAEDQCIHMFSYRKNINTEKQEEILSKIDQMTGYYNKKTTEKMIDEILLKKSNQIYAFFILDIDNFKLANDQYGHAFGDECIKKFTEIIKLYFNQDVILGRLGGDEFAIFTTIENLDHLVNKAKELSKALDIIYDDNNQWHMTASIGIAIAPFDGNNFDTLYRNSDKALYQTKHRNKNDFTIYNFDNMDNKFKSMF